MNRARVVMSVSVLTLLSGLLGCDVAVVAVLATRTKSRNNSNSGTPTIDLSYGLYVANFATPALAANEAVTLNTNGGNPSAATWTLVGRGTATEVWRSIPAGKNAALIQGPLNQVYNIDTFESLDAAGAVIEVPSASNVYANSAVPAPFTPASGTVDGLAVATKITDPAHIPCIFALFTQQITSLRVRIWGANQTMGDCVWSNHHELGGADAIVVGNAAPNSSGTLFTTFVDTTNTQSFIVPFSSSGSKGSALSVSTTASSSGGISVAVDTADNVFVASALSTGNIQLQKYTGGISNLQWATVYLGNSGGGVNTNGPNSLAVASNVPLLTSPGTNGSALFIAGSQGPNGTHTLVRFDDTPIAATFNGVLAWGPKTLADPGGKPTLWSGVTTSGSTDVLTTGDINNNTSGNIEVLTQDSAMSTGSVVWPSSVTSTGGGAATNNGNAIGIDGQGFAYVAGNFGSAANGKDSVLLRYKISDGSGLTTLFKNSAFTGANEFLGIAVDTDGTTYVVGYVTLSDLVSTTASGSTTSMWIGRFAPGVSTPIWTATFNNGVGNDQAVSVCLSGNFVYVFGQETVTGPKLGTRVFKFVK
ncbi:MAG TPA: hypothetical protein VKW04_12185 [Planctomycetota bacterium]|nr:hypothetical protein [Planctomycetota bacterium]